MVRVPRLEVVSDTGGSEIWPESELAHNLEYWVRQNKDVRIIWKVERG